jgi:hypothetical protein
MSLYGLSAPPQAELRSVSPRETVVHASLGANEIRDEFLSDGADAGIAVSEGKVVTVVEVGYAVVVTPNRLMQEALPVPLV